LHGGNGDRLPLRPPAVRAPGAHPAAGARGCRLNLVDDLDTARALAAWGVKGFIGDAPERLAPLRANAPA
jgi:hypothetical protein